MENSCWQILLQSNAFHDWTDIEKKAIANLFHYSGKLEDIKINDVFQSQHEQEINYTDFFSAPIYSSEYVDKRIRAIKFYNFRSFPAPKETESPLGIRFTKGNEPCSLFLVGGNGTGKSTIYSALEYHYTGFCSHSTEMVCNIEDYLTFGFGRIATIKQKDVHLLVERQDSVKTEDGYSFFDQTFNSLLPICPTSAFCSDYDVEQIRQNGEELYDYILRLLGYGRFEKIKEYIERLKKNIGEIKKSFNEKTEIISSADFSIVINNFLNTIKDEETDIKECELYINQDEIKKEIEGTVKHQPAPSLFSQQWKIVKKSRNSAAHMSPTGMIVKNDTPNDLEYENQIKSLAVMYSELRKIFDSKSDMSKSKIDETNLLLTLIENITNRKRELESKEIHFLVDKENTIDERLRILEKINTTIQDIQHRIVLQFTQSFQDEISDVLKEFSADNEIYQVVATSNTFGINIQVPKEGGFPTNPYEYFNSFRFKLFCISLKIALAISWMRNNKTIVPFVIDDVFNANDFMNGLKLERFVQKIYSWYEKLITEDGCNIPFQLIMLTHDDMMQTAFKKGVMKNLQVVNIEKGCKETYIAPNMVCARLFPYKDIKEIRKTEKTEYKNLYLDESDEI